MWLLCRIFFYAVVFILAYRLVVIKDNFALPLPPWCAAVIRFRALLFPGSPDDVGNTYATFPLPSRLFLLVRMGIYAANSAVWLCLWTVDDILYPAYRDVPISKPVFLVGGFRTGSTSLHRALNLDAERYVTPRFLELVFPFIVFHKFLDFLEGLDKKLGTSIIHKIEARAQAAIGPEIMAQHPMSFYEAEEDDVLFAAWHLSGWYTGTMFPSASAWIACGQTSTFPEASKLKMWQFYQRVVQKVLWRRGQGRAYLSKSHLIEFMPTVAKMCPDAHFVGTVRNPCDTFVSWYALSQSASLVMGRWQLPTADAVKAHYVFWDKFGKKECDFFRDAATKRGAGGTACATNKTLVPFVEYMDNQVACVKGLYKDMRITVSKEFDEALKNDEERHRNYKQTRTYTNPTLEELGTSAKEVEDKMGHYIEFFKLQRPKKDEAAASTKK